VRDSVTASVEVAVSPDLAFDVFTREIDSWYRLDSNTSFRKAPAAVRRTFADRHPSLCLFVVLAGAGAVGLASAQVGDGSAPLLIILLFLSLPAAIATRRRSGRWGSIPTSTRG